MLGVSVVALLELQTSAWALLSHVLHRTWLMRNTNFTGTNASAFTSFPWQERKAEEGPLKAQHRGMDNAGAGQGQSRWGDPAPRAEGSSSGGTGFHRGDMSHPRHGLLHPEQEETETGARIILVLFDMDSHFYFSDKLSSSRWSIYLYIYIHIITRNLWDGHVPFSTLIRQPPQKLSSVNQSSCHQHLSPDISSGDGLKFRSRPLTPGWCKWVYTASTSAVPGEAIIPTTSGLMMSTDCALYFYRYPGERWGENALHKHTDELYRRAPSTY